MLKKLLKKITSSLFFLAIPSILSAEPVNDCATEPTHVCMIAVKKNLHQALASHNLDLFAEQFDYPFRINLGHCRRTIHDKKELIANFAKIFTQQDINEMLKSDVNQVFQTSQGVGLMEGIWASNMNAKVFVINTSGNNLQCDPPSTDEIISPTQDIKVINKFVKLFNSQIAAKARLPDYETLTVHDDGGEDSYVPKYYLTDKTMQFVLYTADINNDGEMEYTLVYPCDGSVCGSDIIEVYQLHNNQLTPLHYSDLLNQEFDLYFKTDEGFIRKKNNKYYLHYRYTQPAESCTYLWESGKINLLEGSIEHCFAPNS